MRHRKTTPLKTDSLVIEKFWIRVAVSNEDECWEWLGTKSNNYGRFYVNQTGKYESYPAHTIALYLSKGIWPNTTQVTCHSCNNSLCCNPKHLYLGTQKDNMVDRKKAGTVATAANKMHKSVKRPETLKRGTQYPNAKLNDDIVRKIRKEYIP